MTMDAEINRILAGDKLDPGCETDDTIDENDRFLVVEESRVTGRVWLSSWASKEDAAAYHDDQEGDDWKVRVLVDVTNGNRHTPVTGTRWEEG